MKVRSNKFNTDLLWNVGSFGIIALIGLLLQVLILKFYDAASVGVFSQLYALYLLLSQLAVAGVQLSMQSYVPKHNSRQQHQDVIVSSSLVLVFFISASLISVAFFLDELVKLIYSQEVVKGYHYILPGLLFFSMNKVLISFHNGNRRMVAFALLNLLRFVFMLIALSVLIWQGAPAYMLASLLSFAEGALFVVTIVFSLSHFNFTLDKRTRIWLRMHYRFGTRALLGNFLLDVNTKVDVLMLGAITGDKMVGLYSIAAQIFEGAMLLPTLFRNNINPIISRSYFQKSRRLTERIIQRSINAFYKILSALALLSVAGFPVVLLIYGLEENFWTVFWVYVILAVGLILSSGFLPFQMVFNQTGHPRVQTQFFFWFFMINVICNYIFISLFGVYGAAIGTALALVGQIPLLKWLSRKYTGLAI